MRRARSAGFTLIELLIAVAIIAIVAAIAVMNYLNSVERARQKRTMADMRTIALAWETSNSEKGNYSAAGFSFPSAVPYDSLTLSLVPTYMRTLPKYDGWGRPLQFGAGGKLYGIRSAGRDGLYETDAYEQGTGANPDCDIVYSNGNFVRYPDSIQGD
ncbi:MAG TPA: prepilin-type N-terminal cleavage/methylation domain-containing protein [Thermoanaerobaculia bacterium]|jgi:prepilin-type N-terminal cleavage/methylation domain-containing protein|nr:prepilin-type N-terminal cleavage/methylation domain-containing protein [Thermoanaerobaculia bacterium]